MQIEKLSEESFDIGVKRFYANYLIKSVCPNCNAPWENNLTEDYLSYPKTNTPIEIHGYCGECEVEWSVGFVKVSVVIEETTKE